MKNLLFISVTILFNFNSSAQKKKAKFPGEMNIQSMIEPIPMSAKFINDTSYIWCGTLVKSHIDHNQQRVLNYFPKGEGFKCINGKTRFTRAIYGTNSGFRFETSDFPEFGLYMPNFGGSVYLALSSPSFFRTW